MPTVEFVGLRCNKATEITFSIIAVFAWVALFVFCPLPSAWKKMKQIDTREFPFYVIVALLCYSEISMIYSAHVMQKPYPFHYGCLQYAAASTMVIGMLYVDCFSGCPIQLAWEAFWSVIVSVSTISMVVLTFFVRHDGVMKYVRVANIVLGIFAYASPLPMVIKTSREKIIPWLPIYLSSACFLNALAWLIVSLLQLTFDPYLMITNGVGAILGLSQLGIILSSKLNLKVYPLNSA